MSEDGSLRASPFFAACARLLVRHRTVLFVLTILGVLAGLPFATQIRIDNSLEMWFLEDDQTLVEYREFKEKYGNDEVILALVDCGGPGKIFDPQRLQELWKASKAIEADETNFRRVLSIGVAPYIGLQGGDTLIVEDLITADVTSAADAEAIREKFLSDPLKKKLLTDMSQRYAVLLIEPVATKEMDVRRPQMIAAVREKLQGFSYKLAGMGVMYDELNRLSIRDGLVFSLISNFVIAFVIYLLYRSKPFLGIVVLVMMLGGGWFIGFYGLFRQNFNMVTIVLPTLMMILSISDVAYVYNNYVFNRAKVEEDREKGLELVFGECLSPCLFTSITNAFGFWSIMTSPMAVLKGFGFFAGMACMAEYVLSMVAAAFVLGLLKPGTELELRRPFSGVIDSWVRLMPKHYKLVMGLLAVATVFGVAGISQLQVDTYSMGFLHPGNPVRVDSDAVERDYGNYLPLEIRLMTGRTDGVKDPEFLARLQKAHDEFEAVPQVERAASILDVLCKLNQVMSDGATASYRPPDSFNAASQLLMLYESDPDNDLEHMTDMPTYSEARLTVRLPMVSAAGLREFERKAGELLAKIFEGTGVTVRFGGYVPLYARIINYITTSQVTSFGTALFFIFLAMALLLKRLDAIWLGIIPNVFPIIMTMGMMGWLGIRLDIASVTIASIALGIAVDDTIHELFLFYEPARRNLDPVESISESLIEAGPAVIATSIIYALGFSALVFASIKSVILFGGLLALTIVFGMLCEITIMPALICMFRTHLDRGRQKE